MFTTNFVRNIRVAVWTFRIRRIHNANRRATKGTRFWRFLSFDAPGNGDMRPQLPLDEDNKHATYAELASVMTTGDFKVLSYYEDYFRGGN
jgi:hypothetical protein